MIGLQRERARKMLGRLGESTLGRQREADVVVRLDRLRIEPQRGVEVRHRTIGPSQRQVDRRRRLVKPRAVGIGRKHRFVANRILGHHLRTEVAAQPDAVGVGARQHLQPQIAHLVVAVLAPSHALRRPIGIAPVRR